MRKGQKITEETRARMSASQKGRTFTLATREKMSLAKKGRPALNRGIKYSAAVRRRMSESRSGAKSWRWKGGVSKTRDLIRGGVEYRLWREAVFKRDNYTCIWCNSRNRKGLGRSVKLEADHIKPFALYPELRFSIDNGRTLCKPCHKTTDTYGGRTRKSSI